MINLLSCCYFILVVHLTFKNILKMMMTLFWYSHVRITYE